MAHPTSSPEIATSVRSPKAVEDLVSFVGETLDLLVEVAEARMGAAFFAAQAGTLELVWRVAEGHRVLGRDACPPRAIPAARHEACLGELGLNLILPLHVEGDLLGVFALGTGHATSPEVRRLLYALADRISMAFRMARLSVLQKEEQGARLRAEALSTASCRTLERLAANADLGAFLGHVVVVAGEQLRADAGAVWRAEADGKMRLLLVLEDGAVRTPSGTDPVMTFAEQAVFIPRQRGEIRVHDLADPQLQVREEVREYLRRRGIRTSVVVPMHLGDDLRGALLLCFVRAPSLSPEEAGLVHAFANQVVLAMELTRLSQVERAAAVAEERNRLARDMHDTIAQQLAAIVRQLEVVASSDSPAAAMRHVSVATEIARDGLVDVRRSIRALRPSSLDGRTLEGALRDVAEKIMRVAPAAIRVDATEERAAVPHEVEDELFGVVHEAIVNAVKHGAARTVDVEVAFEEGSVRVAVRDDGAGFDVGNTPAGVGLSSMQERARRIGAALTIASEPGSGSEVLVFWSGNAR